MALTERFLIDNRGIYTLIRCNDCANEAQIIRPPDNAPAHALLLLSVANVVNAMPRGTVDEPGVLDAVRLLDEALRSFAPDYDEDYEVADALPGAEAPTGAVWISADELLAGRGLPVHPVTGASPRGVSFETGRNGTPETAYVEYCAEHLPAEDLTLDPLIDLDLHGQVLYQTPTHCRGCATESAQDNDEATS